MAKVVAIWIAHVIDIGMPCYGCRGTLLLISGYLAANFIDIGMSCY